MDFEAILSALDSEDGLRPTDDQLSDALAAAREVAAEARQAGDLEMLEAVAPAVTRLAAEVDARAEAATAAEARLTELATELGVDLDEEDADSEVDDDADTEVDEEDQDEPALTAASIISTLRAQVANRPAPDPEPDRGPDFDIRAVGNAAGDDIDPSDLPSMASIFHRYAKSVNRPGHSANLIHIDKRFPDDRQLTEDADRNTGILNRLIGGPQASTAAICGPGDVDHDLPVCGEAGRPVWSVLPQLMAPRGQLSYHPALNPFQAPFSDGVAEWDGVSAKVCADIVCDVPSSCEVEAIYACATIGNFEAKFSPEIWEAALTALALNADRVVEQKLLTAIDAASSACTAVTGYGTASNARQSYGIARAYFEQVYRISDGPFTVIAPSALREAANNSVIANQADGTDLDVDVASLLFPGATVAWTVDDVDGTETCDAFAATYGVRIFPTGTFFGLDGGTIDLGTEITDSALNAANERQAFSEEFLDVCFRGCESLLYEIPVEDVCGCPEVVV